jgi:hypothetical protein
MRREPDIQLRIGMSKHVQGILPFVSCYDSQITLAFHLLGVY